MSRIQDKNPTSIAMSDRLSLVRYGMRIRRRYAWLPRLRKLHYYDKNQSKFIN